MKTPYERQRARRPKGSGSFWYSATEGRWRASARDANGRRRSLSAGSQAEIIERLGRLQFGAQNGSSGLVKRDSLTLASWLDEWLASQSEIKESTCRRYVLDVRTKIVPELGSIQLPELTIGCVQEWLRNLQAKGLSASSSRHALAVLRSALAEAQRRGHLDVNVAQLVKPPRQSVHVAGSMTHSEVLRVLDSARQIGVASELRWRLALVWGLRQGEVLGLQWRDIDWVHAIVVVERSLAYVPGSGLRMQPPKSKRSIRRIPVDKTTIELFHRHATDIGLHAGDRVVFSSQRGTPVHPRNDYRQWSALCQETLGRRMRLHDCRHVAITMMLASGLDPQTVSTVVGHSGLTMTLGTYGRSVPRLRQEALRSFGDSVT